MTVSGFPPGFLWGAATSAYQIEGSPLADGAGPSIWHRFGRTPGRVAGGDTGDVACDHYRRMPEDVALLRQLGLGAYRFSIAWGRVLPAGTGATNERGLDFYRRLVDELLAAGIAPVATLYHWDLPAALDDRGGWKNEDVAGWFAEYAAVCARALGDRVALWATLNEPWVVADGGYRTGVLAPGERSPFAAARAARGLLRAHAAGVAALRAHVPPGRVGLVVNLEPKHAASESAEDQAAARRADAYMNRHFLDPALLGRWPEELPGIYGEAWEPRWAEEAAALRAPIDWLGINYYKRGVERHEPEAWAGAEPVRQEGAIHTALDWEVYPPGLGETLRWARERYGALPLYVTENGAAFDDPPPGPDGVIDDAPRLAYVRDHLRETRDAIADGVDVRGWFAWSLLDNFEWSHGYAKRFGIVHVDYATGRRTPKRSAEWYAALIHSGGAALG